jgi:UDP-glucose 4-epimerase
MPDPHQERPDVKVVVTGGAGFIGANLCRRLVAHPDIGEVVALDDLSTGVASNLDAVDCRLVIGSFLDDDLLRDTVAGAAAIVHLGARPSVPRSIADPVASHEANATGTLRVLDAARALDDPIVVVGSSSSVYGANPELPKHELMTPMPMSPYAVSKLATEQYALAWQHSFGMRTLALRFFNVFGPLQAAGHAYAAVVPAFVDAALASRPLTVHGDGQQSRDFTYVGTVCDVLVDAVVRGVTSDGPVNLAFGSRTTLLELIDLLGELLGHDIEVEHVDARPGDVRHSQAANDRLLALFPTVEPLDLRTGLAETIAWMRADDGGQTSQER